MQDDPSELMSEATHRSVAAPSAHSFSEASTRRTFAPMPMEKQSSLGRIALPGASQQLGSTCHPLPLSTRSKTPPSAPRDAETKWPAVTTSTTHALDTPEPTTRRRPSHAHASEGVILSAEAVLKMGSFDRAEYLTWLLGGGALLTLRRRYLRLALRLCDRLQPRTLSHFEGAHARSTAQACIAEMEALSALLGGGHGVKSEAPDSYSAGGPRGGRNGADELEEPSIGGRGDSSEMETEVSTAYNETLTELKAQVERMVTTGLFLTKIERCVHTVSNFETFRQPIKGIFTYLAGKHCARARRVRATAPTAPRARRRHGPLGVTPLFARVRSSTRPRPSGRRASIRASCCSPSRARTSTMSRCATGVLRLLW